MSKLDCSSQISKTQKIIKDRKMTGFTFFSTLFKLIGKYVKANEYSMEQSSTEKQEFLTKERRLQGIQQINKFVQKAMEYQLLQDDLHDCLIQSLQLINKIHGLLKNDIQTRSKQLSFKKQQQQIQALQRSVIQKLVEVILIKICPKKITVKSVRVFICIIIEQLYQFSPNAQQAQDEKRKTKKPQKKRKYQKVNIECRMYNGAKINIIWYLMFRAVQKNLENFDQIWKRQQSQFIGSKRPSFSEMIDKHIFKYINQIINHVILVEFKELNLLQQFLKAIVQNVNQYELPIVPYFLKGFHNILQQKFKLYYTLGIERDISQKITTKEVFCLQNISILLELIKTLANQTIFLQPYKLPYSSSGFCSYCGILRTNSMERLFYQKISISLTQTQNLVVKICEECCLKLNTSPKEQTNLIALAPLILSRFWKNQFGNNHYPYIKKGLKTTMKYHSSAQITKKHKQLQNNIDITDKVAMNNDQQKISHSILQQIYTTFLSLHSQLSIKHILLSLIKILMICWNSKDQKMRDKSIKVLGRSSFLQLFNQIKQKIPLQFKEFQQIRQKIVKALYVRLRDNSSTVSLCSLDLLTDFFLQNILSNQEKDGFFDIVLQLIRQKEKSEFKLKSLDLIEKIINKTHSLTKSNKPNSLLNYLRCLIKTMNLCKYSLLSNTQTPNQINESDREQFSKLLCKLINKVIDFCDQRYPLQIQQFLLNQCNQFPFKQNHTSSKFHSLNEIEGYLIMQIYSEIKIDAFLFKNLPPLTPSYFCMLFRTADNNNDEIQANIKNNILFIIDLIYQQVVEVRQHMFGIIKRSSSTKNQRVNNHNILQYLHSPVFLSLLLQCKQENQQAIPKPYKIEILSKLLYLNNMNQIIVNSREMTNYMTLWLKTKQKSANYIITKIITNQVLEQKLQKLSTDLLQNIKQTNINILQQEISLIVNIKIYSGNIQELKKIIEIYQKYCQRFNKSFLMQSSIIKTEKNQQNWNQFLSIYITITRCIHISTAFITHFQKYLILNQKMQQFCSSNIESMIKSKSRRSSGSTKPFKEFLNKKNNKNQMITTSASFKNLYLLILNLLQTSNGIFQNEPYYYQLVKKNLFLLQQYWKVHSKIVFLQPKLLNIFKQINQNQRQNFMIIKQMYKLFESLLPTNSLQLLNFIRDQFNRKFPVIIRASYVQMDDEIVQISFNIIYHLLRSGMDGLYCYNKYIYLGLFHESEKANQIVFKIISEMYSEQMSEKILFINIGECLQLISDVYFKNNIANLFQQVKFTQIQKRNLKILSQIGRKQGTQFLPKQKKQIKLRTTFVKKIGDYIGNELNLIKNKPKIFLLIMKLLKCQKNLDYIELSQIIFCLSKVTKTNKIFAQKIIQNLKNNISQIDSNQVLIILAYRQLVSCLAYFSKYSDSTSQIKNYSNLFETCINPYLELQETVPLTILEQQQSLISKIQKIQSDIGLFMEIVIGGVEYLPSKNIVYDQQTDDPEVSNQTAQTKPKIQSKLVANRGNNKKNQKLYPSKSAKHFNVTLEQLQAGQIADSYKSRLRQQKSNIYFSDQQ